MNRVTAILGAALVGATYLAYRAAGSSSEDAEASARSINWKFPMQPWG